MDLTLTIRPDSLVNTERYRPYERYYMHNIYFVLSYDPAAADRIDVSNAGMYKNYYFIDGEHPYIRRENVGRELFHTAGASVQQSRLSTIPIPLSAVCALSSMSTFVLSWPGRMSGARICSIATSC